MIKDKIVSLEQIKDIRIKAKKEGKKVVFTNGCFDILHRGHVEYLEKARMLGDILIVGLNTDNSVRKWKKDNKRPINNEEDRSIVLSALESVNYVVLFDDLTPERIISEILPDVLVKGGDYDINQIVGRDIVWNNGGEVKTIRLTDGKATTNVIKTILERYK